MPDSQLSNIHNSKATVTVWGKDSDGPLHDGRAVEYIVTVMNGRPQYYQRTLYEDGNVVTTVSSTDTTQIPDYIKQEVNNHLMPRGTW